MRGLLRISTGLSFFTEMGKIEYIDPYDPCSMFECRILRGNFIWIQIWIGYFLFYHQTTNNKLDRSKPATGNRIIIVQIKFITWRNL